MTRSENRSYDLSYDHYAYKWVTCTYTVASTNELAVRWFDTPEGPDKEDLSLELVKRFHSLLYKFMKLLVTGKPDLKSSHQKAFLNLFMSGNKNMSGYKLIAAQCTIVFRSDTPDDIYNQLVVLFLQLLKMYNPELNVGFVYYINYFFKYHLKKFMVSKYYDAFDYQYIDSEDISAYLVSEATMDSYSDNSSPRLASDKDNFHYRDDVDSLVDGAIDLLRIRDYGPLRSLTSFEKYVIYLLTIKDYKQADVKKIFNLSNNSLASTMHSIKKKLGRPGIKESVDAGTQSNGDGSESIGQGVCETDTNTGTGDSNNGCS